MNLTTFFDLFSIVTVLFLLLATGFLCRKLSIIDDVASKRLSKLIISVGQPMLIIAPLISKPFDVLLLKEGLIYLLIGFLIHPIMALLAMLASPLFPNLDQRKLSYFALTFTNCGFVGFPILDAIFPGSGAFNGAFFIIGFQVNLWTLGIWMLSGGREDIRLTPKKALFNHGTISCAIGLALYFLKAVIAIPDAFIDYSSYLSHLCLPISVLITGALMATQSAKEMFGSVRIYIFNFVKLIGIPLIVCLLAKAITLGLNDELAYNIILFSTVISALPSAATITMLAELYDIEPGYAAQTVSTSSLLSIATLPLLYFVGDLIAKI